MTKRGILWLAPAFTLTVAACSAAGGQSLDEDPAVASSEPEPEAPPAESNPDRVTRVEVATVASSAASIDVRLPGEVEGSRDALLAASLGGFVERVHVHDGDRVKRGQVLVRVDSELRKADVARAEAELRQAERDHERAQSLGQAIARREVENAETAVATARAALRTAKIQLSRALVRAPFDGVVADVAVEEGEVAAAGAPVVRLVQLDPVQVSLAVADRDVVALRQGMAVRVSSEAGGRLHDGVISHVSPAADLSTRAFTVEVDVDNPDGYLLPGMVATVEATAAVQEDRIVLPQHVLVTGRDANGVFVVRDGVAHWRTVDVGQVLGRQVLIDDGVETGDVVVVTGHRELADGDAVLIAREGTCCREGRVRFGDR